MSGDPTGVEIQTDRAAGTSPERHVAGAYLTLFLLGGVNLFNFMDRILFSVMVEPIKAELQFSDTQLGLLGGFAFSLFYGVVGLFIGRLADTRNRVRIVTVALVLWSIASALSGLARNFVQMFLARAAIGIGESGCVPSAHSLIGDTFPPERRSLAISIFTGTGTVGTLVGLIVGGILVEAHGWRMTFVYFGIAGVLFAPVAYLLLKEPPRGAFDTVQGEQEDWGSAIRLLMGRRTVRRLILGIPLLFVLVGVATWIPAFFHRVHGVSTAEFGRAGGASLGLGILFGTFAGGFIANALVARNRLWEFWWPALTALASIPLLALLYTSDDLTMAYVYVALAFFVASTGFGPGMASMQVVAESTVRGTLVAIMLFATSLISYGAAPAFIGYLSDVFIAYGASESDGASLRSAMLAALVFPVLCAVMFLFAARSATDDAVN